MDTNAGNGYNNGIFDAPVSGMYVFFWTVSCTDRRSVATELVKNGARQASVYADSKDGDDYANAPNTAVMQVDKGQQVHVRYSTYTPGGYPDGGYRTIEGGDRDSFSGWLLYET